MTDKPIIIDGVDLAKCKYYNNGWCLLSESCDQIKYRSCGDMTLFDCHYRNWQRKEQECEELKETLAEIKEIAETISLPMGTGKSCNRVILAKQIIQKISECEGNNDMENN